ncbi:hypothetical protein BC830DRAFT_1089817 [Chytriomyces sp. MP71]|nr:hypothetical protein BC830DRAFT_1089817 [Chytriomyces sp. MP71]
MMIGNSQMAKDAQGNQVAQWGLGNSEASGVCYKLTGPNGDVTVALVERCGGYCTCPSAGVTTTQECGPCVNALDLTPQCGCVGPSGLGLTQGCCGANCGVPIVPTCDWCASNNHPHFDLDQAAFNHLCGAQGNQGSCPISAVSIVSCPLGVNWPPTNGGGAVCSANSFNCGGKTPDTVNQPLVPGTQCCCNWGKKPQSDGSCA